MIDLLQWPAMAVTLVAAWLVASWKKSRREPGFWCFVASNLLWVARGWHDHAWALVALQVGLLALNPRGARNNEAPASRGRGFRRPPSAAPSACGG